MLLIILVCCAVTAALFSFFLRGFIKCESELFECERKIQERIHDIHLPVIPSCASCGWHKVSEIGMLHTCRHPKEKNGHLIDAYREPPSWCPMRKHD